MKKTNLFTIGIIFSVLMAFTGCKKDKDPITVATATTKPNDQQGSSAADGAFDDANDFINNKIGGGSGHRTSAYNLPCGVVSLDSSTTNTSGRTIYKMQYGSQTPCGYKKKSGYTTFELISGTAFHLAGSVYKLSFIDHVIESNATGEIVTINGYLTVENVNGGFIWESVTKADTIVYKTRGTFSVKHSDGTVREKKYFKRHTYTSPTANWSGLSLSIGGDTLIGAAKVFEMGKTYEGDYNYQTDIITNFTWSNCATTNTYAGPYVLKSAHARMNITIPAVTPTYIDIEGGYKWDYSNATATPSLVNDCTSNAYKITTVIAAASTVKYQLY